jgi:CRISPR-associated protein Csm3
VTPVTAAGFDRFERRVVLNGWLVPRTSLHIGGTRNSERSADLLSVIRTVDGVPYVPGSSLKGVLRAVAERIAAGLAAPGDDRLTCGRSASAPSCRGYRTAEGRDDSAADADDETAVPLCLTCAMFGSPRGAARISVADLPPESETAADAAIRLKPGVGIDRDRRRAQRGVKYELEVVDPLVRFALRITALNATDPMIGLLVIALDEMGAGHATLGGFTSRGLGRVEPTLTEVEDTRREDLLEQLAGRRRPLTHTAVGRTDEEEGRARHLAALEAAGGDPEGAAARLGVTPEGFSRMALPLLTKGGYVVARSGRYHLTEAGRAALAPPRDPLAEWCAAMRQSFLDYVASGGEGRA